MASATAKEIARKILTPGEVIEDESREFGCHPEVLAKRIHVLKLLSQEQPRNPILWMDLALAYTILGILEKAARAVKIATNLAPTNRFILRSAARFYVHQDDPEYAFRLLKASESTLYDPWLLAAEIAVASASGLKPRSIRPAKQLLLDRTRSPIELTELASAVATLEFESGKHGSARKLFRTSLIEPNENSVAQAEWASKHITGLDIQVSSFKVPRLFEAKAWESFANGDWDNAAKDSINWYKDQPFSSRPAVLSSYLAATILENYKQAEQILRQSLVANPSSPILLNNLAFTYASTGRVDEAEEAITKINPADSMGSNEVAVLATRGLIRFRRGFPDVGRTLYLEAIEKARKLALKKYKAIAAIYLAREEILANSDHSAEAVKRAFAESKSVKDCDVSFLLQRLEKLQKK